MAFRKVSPSFFPSPTHPQVSHELCTRKGSNQDPTDFQVGVGGFWPGSAALSGYPSAPPSTTPEHRLGSTHPALALALSYLSPRVTVMRRCSCSPCLLTSGSNRHCWQFLGYAVCGAHGARVRGSMSPPFWISCSPRPLLQHSPLGNRKKSPSSWLVYSGQLETGWTVHEVAAPP